MSEMISTTTETEITHEREAKVLGRLRDLGLGNPEGIPSYLADASDEELQTVADRDNERLVEPDDTTCPECIDGRSCLSNADGSPASVHLRRVGGSASNIGVALNADASITQTFDVNSPLKDDINKVDEAIGYRSAHLGGCGGANGEITDDWAIHENPAVLEAAKTLLSVPEVERYLGLDTIKDSIGNAKYAELFAKVRENAGKTAKVLEEAGWNGQAYVDGVTREHPENVEDLAVDENDHAFHGHKEPKLTIIVGDKTMPLDDDGFTWNLKTTKDVAQKLAGQRGAEGYAQAVIAEVAKHMAVADRLPSDKTPVFLQTA